MTSRKNDGRDQPTPDDLAGIPVCGEETSAPRRARGAARPASQATPRAAVRVRGIRDRAPATPPTPDDLAGTAVSATGKENVGVRPAKKRRAR